MSRAGRTVAMHADWLSLVEPDGPFLTASVLRQAFPDGLVPTAPGVRADAKFGWDDACDLDDRANYVELLLCDVLGWGGRYVSGEQLDASWQYVNDDHGVTVRPSGALVGVDGTPRVLVSVHPPGMRPNGRLVDGSGWVASPVQRLSLLCRSVGCELGLVTDGNLLTLVYAPANAPTGQGTWRASLFSSEPAMLDSLVSVLGLARFFGVAADATPEALLRRSADNRSEITNTLGRQARRAVELLVNEISRANRESAGRLLAGVSPHEVYEAAVTVLMRLVICLTAEERGLLPIDEPLYASTYAVSTLRADLEEVESASPELLANSCAAWHRVLAASRALHGGVQHGQMRIAPYGSRLFDPDRYPFLEGRAHDGGAATAITISDLSMLGILRALQELVLHGEVRSLSYKHLDVEQIGHVYESLLDHDAVAATQPVLGLEGRKGLEPELALHELESRVLDGREALVAYLHEHTGRGPKELHRLLDADVPEPLRRALLEACDANVTVRDRLLAYVNLLRTDLRGVPLVFPAGSVYVTETGSRRDSGTAYTTRELAEEMARYTLEPLVFSPGPADTDDRSAWRLRSSNEILALKVCEPAVGSGAILVAACRYLAERLLEAWIAEGVVDDRAAARTAADDPTRVDVLVDAQRAVAERCLYAVDRNPMAVEMAKLSLWLVTLSKDRPFSFLDHAIVCGDTLLGITDVAQLTAFHMGPARGAALHAGRLMRDRSIIEQAVEQAAELRREIEQTPVRSIEEADRKTALLAEARAAIESLTVAADVLIGAALTAHGKAKALDTRLTATLDDVVALLDGDASQVDRLRERGRGWIEEGNPAPEPRRTLHWPLAFPEVARFDAFLGNPPFSGGQKITGNAGTDLRDYLVAYVAGGARGSADLCAYFFLRAAALADTCGFLATNTISQGDTREVGLDRLLAAGWTIYRAVKSRPWPGMATLEVSQVWLSRQPWASVALDGATTPGPITSQLGLPGRAMGAPLRLAANAGQSFQGSNILGLGFTMSPEAAQALIDKDPRNADVLFPYLNGEDLNTSPTQSASRWVINFFDWPEERAREYPDCFEIVERLVKPERERITYSNNAAKFWWRYERARPEMYTAIAPLDRCLAIALVSKTVQFVVVSRAQVFSHMLGVVASSSQGAFGTLTSTAHWLWALRYGSTLESRVRYTPSDVYETFPKPGPREAVAACGAALDEHRRALMLDRQIGLTKTYNLVHDARCADADIAELRAQHVALDDAVLAAYGWDVPLDHEFHPVATLIPTGKGAERGPEIRYAVSPAAQAEILDRLLELNHERHAAEQAATPAPRPAKRPRPPKPDQGSLL